MNNLLTLLISLIPFLCLARIENRRYAVLDISPKIEGEKGRLTFMATPPNDGWGSVFRRSKIVLRRVEPGSFTMGSPLEEEGRSSYENLHRVEISEPYYIGIFEITQGQWTRVMGKATFSFTDGERPADQLSYEAIRGRERGGGFPLSRDVDPESFIGRLRTLAGLASIDLPTEAQWEYACRAGTSTPLNSAGIGTNGVDRALTLAVLGRFRGNQGDGKGNFNQAHTRVGMYIPNAWGLYDMHGNVWEWCADWWGEKGKAGVDPDGPFLGRFRVLKGGGWPDGSARYCRSAARSNDLPGADSYGCRIVLMLPGKNDSKRAETLFRSGTDILEEGGNRDGEALHLLLRSARKGWVPAMNQVGLMLMEGRGVPLDYRRAAVWFRRAAEGGSREAFFNLANLYADGRGVEKDGHLSRNAYRIAAGMGYPPALFTLGKMEITEGKREKGISRLRLAAESGGAEITFQTGLIFYYGEGIPRSFQEAFKWIRLAAEKGHPDAAFLTSTLYRKGQGVAPNRNLALKWLKKAHALGQPDAEEELRRFFPQPHSD